MSSPLDTPSSPNMAAEEARLMSSSPSSDSSPMKSKSTQNLVPEIQKKGPLHNDPPETIDNDGSLSDKDSSSSSTTGVPLMDWVEFESQYKKALTDANEVEDQLVMEFEKLSKVSRNTVKQLSETC